jgi:hypothetical protein
LKFKNSILGLILLIGVVILGACGNGGTAAGDGATVGGAADSDI